MQGRLQKELAMLVNNPPEGVAILIDDNNQYKVDVLVTGPTGTPYEGGTFKLLAEFENYPFKAPKLKFLNKIYHPNIRKDTGEICADMYEKDWVPTKKFVNILELITSLLMAPNLDTPLENDIADQYRNRKDEFDKVAREWTLKYANNV